MKEKITIAAILITLAVAGVGTALAQGPNAGTPEHPTLFRCNKGKGCKACSCVVTGMFRDTVTVPDEWTPASCLALCEEETATSSQLVCLSSNFFTFGTIRSTPTLPSPPFPPDQNTCGW
jgi:hypothetical protein